MSGVNGARRVGVWLASLLAGSMIAGGAAAAAFVGDGLKDVSPESRAVVAHPQPVQLIFQFETKGAPNARVTKALRPKIVDVVKASGLFSEVDDGPVANGAILSVVLNDAPTTADMQNAEGKGFVTGATFFVVGSTLDEHYKCTVEYVASPTAPTITRSADHDIIFQMGIINSEPQHAVKVSGGLSGAILTMTRQIVSNPLNEVAKDPGFQTGAAPAAPAATADTPKPSATPDTTSPPSAPVPTPTAAPAVSSTLSAPATSATGH